MCERPRIAITATATAAAAAAAAAAKCVLHLREAEVRQLRAHASDTSTLVAFTSRCSTGCGCCAWR